jgi:hypothetical protein
MEPEKPDKLGIARQPVSHVRFVRFHQVHAALNSPR